MADSGTLEHVIGLLAPTLGLERARTVIEREAQDIGLGPKITDAEIVTLLKRLERMTGTVGLAAQLALRKLKRTMNPNVSTGAFIALGAQALSGSETGAGFVPPQKIVELFSKALGDEKASDLIGRSITRLGLRGSQLTTADATRLLDFVEAGGGVAGAVARFAKVRFFLTFGT